MLSSINPVFTANIKSPKLKFKREDFFVKIEGYGKDLDWADSVIKTTDNAVKEIREESKAESVLKLISDGVKKANANILLADLRKIMTSGILRTNRKGWECRPEPCYTLYEHGRYKSYAERLNMVCMYPLTETPEGLSISRPKDFCEIEHGDWRQINNSLKYVFKSFQKIFPKYLQKDAQSENLSEINSTIAEIRWVLAHATPWLRGSDAISNAFMRAMYKALSIKSYPLKEGVSLDLEAYCTELEEYKKRFSEYFEKPPEIIE